MSKSLFAIVSLLLFVAGFSLLFGSVNLGSESANAYLRSQGGSMDTAQFTIILQGYIDLYRWAGSVLSIISGLSFVKTIDLK